MKTLLDKPVLFRNPDYKKKILLFDIETAPNIGAYFELYKEGNIVWNVEHWYMLSFAYKWLGEKDTYVYGLPDFKGYKKDKTNDEEICRKLWELFNMAEVIIAHNGDQFDIKKSNARFIKYGFDPPSPYKTIDTKKLAKSVFKFDSNKLDDLGDYLKIGRKMHTGGLELWMDCMKGEQKAWKVMKEYNKQDVVLLEKVYLKLRGWSKNQPNMNLVLGGIYSCPVCGSAHTIKRGYLRAKTTIKQAYQCLNCGKYSSGETMKIERPIS